MKYINLLRVAFTVLALSSSAQAISYKLDLRTVANRAYIDDSAKGGKGGWCGQGRENSLVGLSHGFYLYAGLMYEILGTGENGDNQILAFDSKDYPTGLKQAEVPVTEGTAGIGRNLYLLHTACGIKSGDASPIGTVAVRCDSGRVVEFPVRPGIDVADWRNPVDQPNATVAYQEENRAGVTGGVYVSRFAVPADAGVPVGVTFHTAGGPEWIVLAAEMTDHDPLPDPTVTWVPRGDQGWKKADMDDLDVRPGTALDFSSIFPSGPAGENGFMIVNKKGELAFEKQPDVPVRFLCCSEVDEISPEATPEEIDSFAEQIARAGYNMLRPHYLDFILRRDMNGTDDINPKQLDQWDHLAADLKKRGIYLFLDISTVKPPLKVPMYYDPAALERWKAGVVALLTHVNPYTGLALKDDPLVAIGQLRNEVELNYLMARKDADQGLAGPFRDWLRKKYGTIEAVKAAWGQQGAASFSPETTFDKITLPLVSAKGADGTDLQLFFIDIQREMFQSMATLVRGLGLRAPLTDFNINYSLESDLTRDVLPLVDNHTYHDHPHFGHVPTDSGTVEGGWNPLLRGISFYFTLPTTRQLGRPFTCSEWGQVFWNPYRFQTGLSIPAYSSLQGWQMISQFTNPIRAAHVTRPFPKVAAEPFRLFKDPAAKAGEYMSALLFRRGDVRQSSHFIEMVLDPKAVDGQLPLQGAPPNTISRLALISTVGTRVPAWPGAAFRGAYHADLSLTPDGTQQIATQDGAQTLTSSTNTSQATEAMFATLRKTGIISADNRSNPTKGLYESDTGQIFLNTQIGTMQITTPMSQGGAVFSGDEGLQLTDLTAKLSGADGAIFAGSLTQQTLAKSPRILLLVVTDALNTHMRFKDNKRLTLVDPGVAPVLMHVSQAEISLHNTAPGTAHLWALAASGERVEEIPVTDKGGILTAHIDTAALHNGPTPYFEIIRTVQ